MASGDHCLFVAQIRVVFFLSHNSPTQLRFALLSNLLLHLSWGDISEVLWYT